MPLPTIFENNCPVKPNLKDMSLEELESYIASFGKEKYRARQIMKWLYQLHAGSFDDMTNLSKAFRTQMKELARFADPEIEKIQISKDGTKKILFRLEDGLFIESVLIPGKNHWTICVSTQAGCAMGCAFCMTGREGLKRNLLPSEITGQIRVLRTAMPEGDNIKNIVMMGMGEPLANYENTLKAIRIITSDFGFGFSNRKITVSTCGLAPMIEQLGKDICVNLAISLNAPDNETRSALMPVNKKYPIETLLDACGTIPCPEGECLPLNTFLLPASTTHRKMRRRLARLLKRIRCKLNLIAVQ